MEELKAARCASAQEVKDSMQTALTGCGVRRYMRRCRYRVMLDSRYYPVCIIRAIADDVSESEAAWWHGSM